MKTKVRLAQLVDERRIAAIDAAGLKEIAKYADVVAPAKAFVTRDLVERAHAAGLLVHVWTFHMEPQFVLADYRDRPEEELRHLAALGVDGIFTDFPDVVFRTLRGTPGERR
jgi:glycerophosphoryl diester phosphodiesterase